MKILSEAGPAGVPAKPVSLAIGVFDGVHLGHQAVIQRTLEEARAHGSLAVAVTFDRHPNSTVAPGRVPQLLCPLWRRLNLLESLGLDAVLVYAFDADFCRQPAEAFIERLRRGFGSVASISVGASFVFGHRRGGNLDLLRQLGGIAGFSVHGLAPVRVGDEVVSSSRLRELVVAGDFDRAALFLGRRHSLAGEVVTGDRLGRRLGFPTANLDVTGLVLPPNGVYAARACCAEGNQRHPAAVNIGRRPTVDGSPSGIRVEAHLLGFEGDLYGRRLHLELHQRLRTEERFPSREALVAQISRDVDAVREWAGK